MTESLGFNRPDQYRAPQTENSQVRPASVEAARVSPHYFVFTPGHSESLISNLPSILSQETSGSGPAFRLGTDDKPHLITPVDELARYLQIHGNDMVTDTPTLTAEDFLADLPPEMKHLIVKEPVGGKNKAAKETHVLPYVVGMITEQLTQSTGLRAEVKKAMEGGDVGTLQTRFNGAKGQLAAAVDLTKGQEAFHAAGINFKGDPDKLKTTIDRLENEIKVKVGETNQLFATDALADFLTAHGMTPFEDVTTGPIQEE